MVKAKFYSCYSINQLRFIKAHGIKPVSKGVNKNTGKTFWVFEVTDELSNVLTTWTNNKQSK
jgi:hypothetical protein